MCGFVFWTGLRNQPGYSVAQKEGHVIFIFLCVALFLLRRRRAITPTPSLFAAFWLALGRGKAATMPCTGWRFLCFLWWTTILLVVDAWVTPTEPTSMSTIWQWPLTLSSTTVPEEGTAAPSQVEPVTISVDESGARSVFGTKEYWDDVYQGRGDFPADCYSWYYGWEILGKFVKAHVPPHPQTTGPHILVPGVGNDSLLVDLVQAGYQNLVGQDYSEHSVERQAELLDQVLTEDAHADESSNVSMVQGDVTDLPQQWTEMYDAVIEKGLLDAVYLSGDGNVEKAFDNLFRVLKPGGVFISVSGVVPEDLRRQMAREAEWLRDGANDLQAGCFVWRKPLA